MLSFFAALVITHFVMDWLFQTSWEAMKKSSEWPPLLVHAFIYIYRRLFASAMVLWRVFLVASFAFYFSYCS